MSLGRRSVRLRHGSEGFLPKYIQKTTATITLCVSHVPSMTSRWMLEKFTNLSPWLLRSSKAHFTITSTSKVLSEFTLASRSSIMTTHSFSWTVNCVVSYGKPTSHLSCTFFCSLTLKGNLASNILLEINSLVMTRSWSQILVRYCKVFQSTKSHYRKRAGFSLDINVEECRDIPRINYKPFSIAVSSILISGSVIFLSFLVALGDDLAFC